MHRARSEYFFQMWILLIVNRLTGQHTNVIHIRIKRLHFINKSFARKEEGIKIHVSDLNF